MIWKLLGHVTTSIPATRPKNTTSYRNPTVRRHRQRRSSRACARAGCSWFSMRFPSIDASPSMPPRSSKSVSAAIRLECPVRVPGSGSIGAVLRRNAHLHSRRNLSRRIQSHRVASSIVGRSQCPSREALVVQVVVTRTRQIEVHHRYAVGDFPSVPHYQANFDEHRAWSVVSRVCSTSPFALGRHPLFDSSS